MKYPEYVKEYRPKDTVTQKEQEKIKQTKVSNKYMTEMLREMIRGK